MITESNIFKVKYIKVPTIIKEKVVVDKNGNEKIVVQETSPNNTLLNNDRNLIREKMGKIYANFYSSDIFYRKCLIIYQKNLF